MTKLTYVFDYSYNALSTKPRAASSLDLALPYIQLEVLTYLFCCDDMEIFLLSPARAGNAAASSQEPGA